MYDLKKESPLPPTDFGGLTSCSNAESTQTTVVP
jgi:hypothetical protein